MNVDYKVPIILTIQLSYDAFTLLEVFLGRFGFFSLSSDDCDIFRLRGFANATGDLSKQQECLPTLGRTPSNYMIQLCFR